MIGFWARFAERSAVGRYPVRPVMPPVVPVEPSTYIRPVGRPTPGYGGDVIERPAYRKWESWRPGAWPNSSNRYQRGDELSGTSIYGSGWGQTEDAPAALPASQPAPSSGGFFSNLGSGIGDLLGTLGKTWAQSQLSILQTKQAAQTEAERQKALISTYGTARALQAYGAIGTARELEAAERARAAEAAAGVTSPMLGTTGILALAGVGALILILAMRQRS